MAVAELYGHRKVLLMLRVHWGSKISLVLLALLFAGFVGIFTDVDGGYLFFCTLLPAAVFVFSDRELFEKVRKRRRAIQLEFPDFVNKLTLLVNAGLTVSKHGRKPQGTLNVRLRFIKNCVLQYRLSDREHLNTKPMRSLQKGAMSLRSRAL